MTSSNHNAEIGILRMLKGTRNFHEKFIKRSTRMRGKVARTQKKTKIKRPTLAEKTPIVKRLTTMIDTGAPLRNSLGKLVNGIDPPPRNRRVARQLTANTLMYSARKNRPKRILEYSVWN